MEQGRVYAVGQHVDGLGRCAALDYVIPQLAGDDGNGARGLELRRFYGRRLFIIGQVAVAGRFFQQGRVDFQHQGQAGFAGQPGARVAPQGIPLVNHVKTAVLHPFQRRLKKQIGIRPLIPVRPGYVDNLRLGRGAVRRAGARREDGNGMSGAGKSVAHRPHVYRRSLVAANGNTFVSADV